jgi:hypothetical protein
MDARRLRKKEPPCGLPVNPPGALLGVENAVLTGTNNRYFVPEFEGCLSIKTVGCEVPLCGKPVAGNSKCMKTVT